MPIRPELRHHYGAAWKLVRAKILERAGNRCEWCRRPNRATTVVLPCGCWFAPAEGRCGEVTTIGRPDGHVFGRTCSGSFRVAKTVLTVAHLNHVPGDDREENLRALCQRCHLRYDRQQHAESARTTRARKR